MLPPFTNTIYPQVVVAQKVVSGIFPGVTTEELDILAAETAQSLSTKHPDYSILAARIAVSNLHKKTHDNFADLAKELNAYLHPKVSESGSEPLPFCIFSLNHWLALVQTGAPAPLLADDVCEIIQKHKDELQAAIDYNRDLQ